MIKHSSESKSKSERSWQEPEQWQEREQSQEPERLSLLGVAQSVFCLLRSVRAPTPQRLRAMAASGVATPSAPVSAIKRGAAMRAKYRNNDRPQAIIPALVAQHP